MIPHIQGCKRDLFFRDRDETDTFHFGFDAGPISCRDKVVFRDVTNGTLCQAYGFKLL